MLTKTYAIGDVHRRADLLEPLLLEIERHADRIGVEPRVLFLGDIVDRGPDSRVCMDLVHTTIMKWPTSRLIRGNHDNYFLDFMTSKEPNPGRYERWFLEVGGASTMLSYGLLEAKSIREAAEVFRSHWPDHLELLRSSEYILVDDTFAYVHAGISPLRGLDDQDPRDLMMIRDEFLSHEKPFSRIIVHGHTPTADLKPDVRPNRIALDTGAYASGRLSCFVAPGMSDSGYFLFSIANDDGRVKIAQEEVRSEMGRPSELANY
ncbi:metallophosphoesterase [Chelativorans sp. YIM 93263]|uniref:metallophosphoesterase n=1 Tax=Chelativorans sp. YIM 93263 TaxID=2906648 RepID=UPI002378CB24|nr:metallophosphoesterase [Chelativorans sp. YIM 93263]